MCEPRVYLKPLALRRWSSFALVKQDEMAGACGVGQGMISRWSQGRDPMPEAALGTVIALINQRLKHDGIKAGCARQDFVREPKGTRHD